MTFSSAGSSAPPGGGALSYLWDFGDGTTSTAANPSHTYTTATPRRFTARLTVSTRPARRVGHGGRDRGQPPPTPTITAPTSGTTVLPGQTVTYPGRPPIPRTGRCAVALSWTVLLHHNTHVHTFVAGSGFGQLRGREPR